MCHCPLERIKKYRTSLAKTKSETRTHEKHYSMSCASDFWSHRRLPFDKRIAMVVKYPLIRLTLCRIIDISLFTQTCYFRHIFSVCIIWSFHCNLFFSPLPFVKLDTFNLYLIYSSFVVHLSNISVGKNYESDLFNYKQPKDILNIKISASRAKSDRIDFKIVKTQNPN